MRPMLAGVLIASAVSLQAQNMPSVPRSVRDGVYVQEQADRGAATYEAYCAYCHGADLRGGVHPDPAARLRNVPPLRGDTFLSNWAGLPLGELFRRMRISMPQDAPGSLSRSKTADVLSFILRENGYPAGQVELRSTDDEWLSAIRIER